MRHEPEADNTRMSDAWCGYDIRNMTIAAVLADKAARVGEKVFLKYVPDGRCLTYREANELSNRIANGLLERGVKKGEQVAVLMGNSLEALLTHFALNKMGAVSVPINTAARGQLLAYYLVQSDAVAVVCDDEFLAGLADIAGDIPGVRLVVQAGASRPAALEALSGKALADLAGLQRASSLPPEHPPRFSDPAFVMYTSGTTGPSKGVLFTHAHALMWERDAQELYGISEQDSYYLCLPLFHAAGLLGIGYLMAVVGGTVVLTSRFSASRFWADVRDGGATSTILMGSMINIVWSMPPAPSDGDNTLRFVFSAPYPKFGAAFEKRFGVTLVAGYGLSDYGTPLRLLPDAPADKKGSLGCPTAGWEVRVVDDDDFPVTTGEVGELVISNRNPWRTSSGYYRMPEATVNATRNGWFHTGDNAYMDGDGYFWMHGRKKDALRRRGENISAFEVEQVMLSHPAVSDVAVYGVRSEMAEDEVAATVVLRGGAQVTYAGLIEHCRRNMAYYMVPRYLKFAGDLPKTLSGKVQKYLLREAAHADPGSLWDREAAGIVVKRGS